MRDGKGGREGGREEGREHTAIVIGSRRWRQEALLLLLPVEEGEEEGGGEEGKGILARYHLTRPPSFPPSPPPSRMAKRKCSWT